MQWAGQWDWNSPRQVQQGCSDWPWLNSSAGAYPDHPCCTLLLEIHLTLPSFSDASSTSLKASLCKRRAEQMDEHQKTSVRSSEASPALPFECVTSHDSVRGLAAESPPRGPREACSQAPTASTDLRTAPEPSAPPGTLCLRLPLTQTPQNIPFPLPKL